MGHGVSPVVFSKTTNLTEDIISKPITDRVYNLIIAGFDYINRVREAF